MAASDRHGQRTPVSVSVLAEHGMIAKWRASVADGGPPLNQNCGNVKCLLPRKHKPLNQCWLNVQQ